VDTKPQAKRPTYSDTRYVWVTGTIERIAYLGLALVQDCGVELSLIAKLTDVVTEVVEVLEI
jgi:hypothetical protein